MRLLEEIINGVLVICVLAKSIEMAELLPAGEESEGSDVSLLDHEQQANPPASYTGNAGPSAPSAGVQQAGQPTGVKQPLQRSVVKPVQYMAQAAPMPITAYPRPSYASPHSYLALTIVTLIICLLLNITSLALGIPAITLSILSYHAVQKNQWKRAEKFGRISLYLSIANWVYVLTLALLAVGLAMGFYYQDCYTTYQSSTYYFSCDNLQ